MPSDEDYAVLAYASDPVKNADLKSVVDRAIEEDKRIHRASRNLLTVRKMIAELMRLGGDEAVIRIGEELATELRREAGIFD